MKNVQRRQWWQKFMTAIIAIGILGAVGTVVVIRKHYQDSLRPLNSVNKMVSVTIPAGATLRETASQLKAENVIKSAWAFERYVQNKAAADKIKAGTYELNTSYDVSQIVSILTEGKIATDLVTILPGARLDQVKKAFLSAGFSDEAVEVALDPSQYKDHPALVDKPESASLEGYLYPESFQRTNETNPKEVIEGSLNEMQKRLTPSIRDAFSAQGLSVYKAVTLASIVEREVSSDDDRAQVAQVFLKRLKSGKRLESDATAGYGAILVGKQPSLTYDSPYNTYINLGLPPGPISNVTESSLRAVAEPAQTDWLYFVSGDDGKTYFSRTLSEHEALTAQHCTKLCN